ncbi:probable beta-D-xylosidase 2 [Oryza brachyantha]|uniref:probable beta-D-xylosidase 2 n=1 Tax=Oryza brachyantha TaxID=4533 RepID=UPI001ADA9FCE|nr:probable beta-D-xylosidase 2 [Oryza brachyantha]
MASSSPRRLGFLPTLVCAIAVSVCCVAGGGRERGPITSNGGNYTKVCDPARFAAAGLDMAGFPYCDASLPYADRVRDLIGRMTLEEKVSNLGDRAAGAARVGLPGYLWWGEALHGVSDVGPGGTWFGDVVPGATSFPLVINAGAAFNETLWRAIGGVVSTEVRAMYNLGHAELTYWSPNINVVRDPRWGRASETPGEDPFVVGRYAVSFVRGMQDIDSAAPTAAAAAGDPFSRPIKVSSCCKHYAAYDVDAWNGTDRLTFDARVQERDMVETFERPFQMCIRDGDASCVMCSYNRINGIPACADTRLLTETVRRDWQLHGYIVSDCDSVRVMVRDAKWLGYNGVEATAASMKAGLDLDCGMFWEGVHDFFTTYGVDAVRQGKLKESSVDNALSNLYLTLMRLGFFDGIPELESLGAGDVCTEAHMELAADAARQGMVLLKNDGALLPLSPEKVNSVALVGLLEHINATDVMLGDYRGKPCRVVTPYDGVRKVANSVVLHACDKGASCDTAAAAAAVKTVDATIVVAGLNMSVERESNDREDLLLPWNQASWIKAVAEASPSPIVLVVMSAGGVDVSFAQDNPKIGAIVWAGYPGEEGGTAIADVLFGKYNPGGRLPLTWYKNEYVSKIPMTSMALRPDAEHGYPGRTYKFYGGADVLYPFGHGLSYTNFTYASGTAAAAPVTLKVGAWEYCKQLTYKAGVTSPACPAVNVASHGCQEEVSFTVTVANTGGRDGAHVVTVYTVPPAEVDDAPLKQLVAFTRVQVPAGAAVEVPFALNVCKAFAIVEKTAYTVVPSGVSRVLVGDDALSLSFPVQIDLATS